MLAPFQQPEAAQPMPAPIQVSTREADQHALGEDQLYLRITQKFQAFSAIVVRVVVDPTGSIVSATGAPASPDGGLKLSPDIIAQAESMVRGLHFKPFLRAGHPVSVTFERYVALLPSETKLDKHIPFLPSKTGKQ
jgi:hypothetical protein